MFSEYGTTAELKDFYNTVKWTSTNSLVFPTLGGKRTKANSRHQTHLEQLRLLKLGRGRWEPATFTEHLQQVFNFDDCSILQILYERQRDNMKTASKSTTFADQGTLTRGAAAKAAAARGGASSATSNDVEASYSNSNEDEMAYLAEEFGNQVALTSRTPPRNANRGARGFMKQAAEYVQLAMSNKCFPLAMGSRQVTNPMSIELIERERKADDHGNKLLRCIQTKCWLKDVCDFDNIELEINHGIHKKIGMPPSTSGRGSCIITLTASKATAASTGSEKTYSGRAYLEEKKANEGNERWTGLYNEFVNHETASLVEANGRDPANPDLDFVHMITPIEEKTGLPFLINNLAWQCETFLDMPADEKTLMKCWSRVPYDKSSKCGQLKDVGYHYFVYWTIPVEGGEAGTLESQTPKKAEDWDEKDTELNDLISGNDL